MVNGLRGASKNGFEIYKKLLEAKNTKIIFLTGTPIVNTPFEVALLFNILRGPLEIIMFRINNFSEDKIDDYISTLIKNDRIGWADLNRKNQSLQVILKLNSWDMEFEQTIRFIESQARYFDAYVNYDKIEEFSVTESFKAVQFCHVVILLIQGGWAIHLVPLDIFESGNKRLFRCCQYRHA